MSGGGGIELTELSERDYLGLVNAFNPGASSPSRLRRLKDQFGFRVKNNRGKLNALAIAPIQWRRLWDAIDKQDNPTDRTAYNAEKKREERAALKSIGEIPAVSDPELRERCDADLKTFLLTAFPKIFHIEWSPDHDELCASLQRSIIHGGFEAVAYQRGFGKTQFCIGAICWGILTGRLPMVLLIAKNEAEAAQIQTGIQRRFETNEKLIELYPEVCWVMATLARGTGDRTYRGAPVGIKTGEMLVLPVIPGSRASEAVIKCAGINAGGIRGSHYDRSDGTTVRPKLVLIDDPQDEVSARNPDTVRKLSEVIDKSIARVNGPNERLSIFMPCTVICAGDLAWQYTDIETKPFWNGRRVPAMDYLPTELLREVPNGLNLWQRYEQILREDLAMRDRDHKRATAFFLSHLDEMTAGAVVRWRARCEPPNVHPVQWLVGLYLIDRDVFNSEFQQTPNAGSAVSSYLNESQLAKLNNGLERGAVPPDVQKLIAAVDIQESVLYWSLVGWAPQFTGYISSWGTWPEQPPGRFTHHNVSRTLQQSVRRLFPGVPMDWRQTMRAALVECFRMLLGELEQNGRPRFVDAVFVDARWERITEIVLELTQHEEFRGRVFACGGQFVGPNRTPLSRAPLKERQTRMQAKECEWYMETKTNGAYMIEFDADVYRSRVQAGLALAANPNAGPGRISYAGKEGSKFLASHLAARIPEFKEGNFRRCEHWKERPGLAGDQDHWNDCVVMARLGAEHEGMRNNGDDSGRPKRLAGQAKITQADVPQIPRVKR